MTVGRIIQAVSENTVDLVDHWWVNDSLSELPCGGKRSKGKFPSPCGRTRLNLSLIRALKNPPRSAFRGSPIPSGAPAHETWTSCRVATVTCLQVHALGIRVWLDPPREQACLGRRSSCCFAEELVWKQREVHWQSGSKHVCISLLTVQILLHLNPSLFPWLLRQPVDSPSPRVAFKFCCELC